MKKFLLLLLTLSYLTSCENKAEITLVEKNKQIDSLNAIIVLNSAEMARKDILIDSLSMMIGIKEENCKAHEKKIDQYKDLVEEYKTVLYAIVGEDGLYHYGDIDYD